MPDTMDPETFARTLPRKAPAVMSPEEFGATLPPKPAARTYFKGATEGVDLAAAPPDVGDGRAFKPRGPTAEIATPPASSQEPEMGQAIQETAESVGKFGKNWAEAIGRG